MDKSEEAVRDAEKAGPTVDVVTLAIDYEIIEHFSQHLYGSPNKAVEELVSNSFDAFARSVYVYLPGKYTADSVLVWDDGQSMGVDGLKQLWWIARSPKDDGDRICRDGDASRKMIGKFGIGKLASYAVGRRITHLCRVATVGPESYTLSFEPKGSSAGYNRQPRDSTIKRCSTTSGNARVANR